MNTKCITLMVLFLLITSSVYGQTSESNIESLRGLKGVGVMVKDLISDIEKDGLRKENIQTDVELKLRLAGIKVLTQEEQFNEPGIPCLGVSVDSFIRDGSNIYAVNISIEFLQKVYLGRDLKIVTVGITWSKSFMGTVGASNVNDIRDSVKDKVDEFINDYLSVNPK